MWTRQVLVHLHERLEHGAQLVARDTHARVVHGDSHDDVVEACLDAQLSARFGELDGVTEQVEQDLLHLLTVGEDSHGRIAAVEHEREPARAHLRNHQRFGGRERLGHGDALDIVLHRARLDARIVEHLVDQAQQMALAGLDACKIGPLLFGDRAA